METNKIIGYFLLLVGILLITIPLWHTYNIFTGKVSPAQVFIKPVSLTVNNQVGPYDIPGQIQNALIKVIPIDFINSTLNLGSWLVLLWVLIYGGGKIAEIGVKLIK